VALEFCLLEVRLGDGEFGIVIEDVMSLVTRCDGCKGGWSDQNTQMCEIGTKRIFAIPFVVRKAKLRDNRGSSETSRIITRLDQLAREVVDRRRENIMAIDNFCESLSCQRGVNRPLADVKQGTRNFLRCCFITSLHLGVNGNRGVRGESFLHQIGRAES